MIRDLIGFYSPLGERWAGGRQMALTYLQIALSANRLEHFVTSGKHKCHCPKQIEFDEYLSTMVNRVQHS